MRTAPRSRRPAERRSSKPRPFASHRPRASSERAARLARGRDARTGLARQHRLEVPHMYRGKRISVVIPCHNEEDGIVAVLAQMPAIVDEVVVVDNCSTDATARVAAEHGARV